MRKNRSRMAASIEATYRKDTNCYTYTQLQLQRSFNGIVQRFADHGADHLFGERHHLVVFGIPVVAVVGNKFEHGDAWIVLSFGEPCFEHWIPQVLNNGWIRKNGYFAGEPEEIGVGGSLEQEAHARVGGNLLVLVAVGGAEEPYHPVFINFLHGHGTGGEVGARAGVGAHETNLCFVHQFRQFFGCFTALKVISVVFGLLLVDAVHSCFLVTKKKPDHGSMPALRL